MQFGRSERTAEGDPGSVRTTHLPTYSKGEFMKYLVYLLILPLLTNCASLGESLLLGAGIGMAAGGGVGAVTSEDEGGMLVGAAIGTALGLGLGFLIHKDDERKKMEAIQIPVGKRLTDPDIPMLTTPEVRRIWEPDRIDGNKFIHGHFIDVLDKSSFWSE